jgi:hypothetical protein
LHALAAHSIFVLRRALEHGDAEPVARQRAREGCAADSAADHHDIGDFAHTLPFVGDVLRG